MQAVPRRAARIQAALSHRWTLVGTTGSGKTYFALMLIAALKRAYPFAHLYILDTKRLGDFDAYRAHTISSELAPSALHAPGQIQVWQPIPSDDRREQIDRWYRGIVDNRQPAIVLTDELLSIGGANGKTYPIGYELMQTMGRAMDVCSISLTQAAAYIPRETFSQVTHLVRFRLQNEYDARTVDHQLGRPKAERGTNPPHDHGFFYGRLDKLFSAMYYKDAKEFFR